ncbi:Cationic amino acid transporter 1 [Sphaceloma murrayae]|uniref:Cationic amino acid transporter 1 n=1 Tax=Sphaceloma murrayae TaxID=2082308 RepID=A0A2K1QJJ2_9PEZI|nr:Cationic amino acid transporter 1 [Sphaceloma murrayae]
MDYDKEGGAKVGSSSPSEDGNVVTGADRRGYVRPSLMTRLGLTADSFRRRELDDAHNQLNQTLKTRHLNMIAIGGSIGAGLFVGSGSSLRVGGPGALLIAFGIIGLMIFNVVYALGELAMMFPISGGFYTYSTRFIDPSWGFAMGWNYCFQWAIILPLELVVAGLTVNYWGVNVNIAIWITVFLIAVIIINVFGVLGYAEEEFWVSLVKLSTIIIFMIMALVFTLGGGPSSGQYSEYWGARLWYDPGALADGFYGVCAVFVNAAFAFSGSELVGLAAAETENPQRSLPSAIKQVFWRITLFYILGLFFVGLLVRYDDERLLGSGSFIDVSASPFVIAANNAGVPRFGDFINAVILLSVISIGLSGVYGASRTLTALAEQGYAPRVFTYVDKAGRPLWSTIIILACGCIAYITLASTGVVVFNWLVSLSGLAALFTWGSICLAHIRFRAAWAAQGHTLDELPFRALFGVYGSWFGLILIVLVLIAQFYVAIKPLDAEVFFQSYLALFVVMLFYFIGWVWKRQSWKSIHELDVDSGRRDFDWEIIHKERARIAAKSKFGQFLNKIW